jgi:hypothetical protein
MEDEKSLPIFGLGLRALYPQRLSLHSQQQVGDPPPIFGFGTIKGRHLRGYRRRGARVKSWRINLREPMLAVMAKFPDVSAAEIARKLLENGLGKGESNIDVRAVQNWLSMIKRGRRGYGRAGADLPPQQYSMAGLVADLL